MSYERKKQTLDHLPWPDVSAKYAAGWGFKRLADHFSVSRWAMRNAIVNRGVRRPYAERTITARTVANAETRAEAFGWRARELTQENAIWRTHDRWWKKAYRRTQMDHYYANHEASKLRARTQAKERWQRLRLTGAYKMQRAARNAIARIARMVGSRRKPKTRTFEFLGCDYDTARRHIEHQWGQGMSWHNHGTAWEIDHIKPLAAHDLTDETQRMEAMHYTNLQPLTVGENRAKSDRYTPHTPPPGNQYS